MNRLYDLDRAILARLQGLTHWTQRTFGVLTATNWGYLALLAAGTNAFMLHAWFALLLTCVDVFTHTYSRAKEGSDTIPWDKVDAFFRVFGIIWSVVFSPLNFARLDYWMVFMVLYMYLCVCQDLPPSKSEIRLWLEKITTIHVPVPNV